MGDPLVSIIVVNYNGILHLRECFNSLNNLDYKNLEIILIDNDSKDKSVEFVQKNYPNVKIIKLHKNIGFTGANNIGVSLAKGKYFILLNNDTYVDRNWVSELIKTADNSKKIAIVASKIYYYNNRDIISYAGGNCDKYGKTSHIGENNKDNKYLNIHRETFYACGASLLIKKDIYKKIGLFDPLYFIYFEDLDLCWRAWIFGYKVIFNPNSFIYHKIGQVMGDFSLKKRFLGERNLLRTLLKNYQISSLILVLPIFYGKRIGIIIKYILRLDKLGFILFVIYLKAFFWNLFQIHSLVIDRKFIQRFRTVDDDFIFKLMKKVNKIALNR